MTANQVYAAAAAGDPAGAGLPLSATERTRHRRLRRLGRPDQQSLYAVLRAGLVAHLGVIIDGWPMVVPTVYGFDADALYLHGSVASQSLATAETPVCVTITLADGLVLARSVFEHSVNYRSAMIYGQPRMVTDPAEKLAGLRRLAEHVAPGQWDYARRPRLRGHTMLASLSRTREIRAVFSRADHNQRAEHRPPAEECRPGTDPGRPPSRQGDSPMMTAVSADGTAIAFDRYGDGPPIIMTAGAFNTRSATEPLARALQERFTVLNYDRRGRGDSGDTAPYAVDREIEDLGALVTAAGGSASVFGYSSGAALAIQAAGSGLAITKLVLYEPPFNPDDSYPLLPAGLAGQLAGLVSAGRRGDAVELYQTKAVGIPEGVVAQMRHAPFRPGLEAIAHTLAYDATIIGDRSLPTELIASVTAPALVISGEQSPPFLRAAARAVAAALPHGRLATLPGQGHDISPEATAPVMAEFLAS